MIITKKPDKPGHCAPIPDFERLTYYYGQDLTVSDFQVEQAYFLEKLRLMNRCFHGTGIVCGLEVKPIPPDDSCDSYNDEQRQRLEQEIRDLEEKINSLDAAVVEERRELQARREELLRQFDELPDCPDPKRPPSMLVWLNCGWAIDCHGREIIVRHPQKVDLTTLLTPEDRRALETAYENQAPLPPLELSVCYCEQPTYPTRPRYTDDCDSAAKCVYGRVREGYRLSLSLEHKPDDTRCSNCCEPCESDCVVLAHIHWNGGYIGPEQIDLSVRRDVSVYTPTVVTGISWVHGATYDPDGAKQVLGTDDGINPRSDGLEVHFSRKVYAETLQPGVVDLILFRGGPGVAGTITYVEGSFVDKPDSGLVSSFKYRDESGETLNRGDRLLMTIRGNSILDECCERLDGEHGGLLPQLDDYVDKPEPIRAPPPSPCSGRRPPWTSGNGRQGATFESWIFIDVPSAGEVR